MNYIQMKRVSIALSFMLLLVFSAPAVGSDMEKAREAFLKITLLDHAPNQEIAEKFVEYSERGRANDVLLMQLYMAVHLPDYEVERLLALFDREAGCWTDIDYMAKDRGRWPSTLHVTRMYALAKAYKAGNEPWKGSESLRKLLHDAMAWWYRNMPECPNWWHNEIGVPKKMAGVLLMMRDELSEEEIAGGLKVLERSQFGRTGQNKAWLAGNNLMKGLLVDDEALVRRACREIQETIYMADGEEGIQPDWSFHQHGPQIQFGNYGLAYAEGLSFWMSVLKGTAYDFSAGQKAMVSNLIKEGISWCVYRGFMDPSYCGRQNFIHGGSGKAFSFAVTARYMAEAFDEEREFYTKLADENLLPSEYPNTLTGMRYFGYSDCGIYRRPDWYASVRMHSSRTIGFEFTNKENTLGNFSADGAVILMQDGKEFTDIFAYWDWRKVPGVTAYDDGKPMKCDNRAEKKKNHSPHVGGLAHEGMMASTMEINRDGIIALKSMFFFEDCIVNLGTGIRGTDADFRSVTTSVDQIHLSEKGFKASDKWAFHADRAYLSLDGAKMTVTGELQRGKWDDIEPSFTDKWDEGKVFKCWFDHPMAEVKEGKASYAYAVFPCTGLGKIKAIAREWERKGCTKDLTVLRNDSLCQAVMYRGRICSVFHEAGTYGLAGRTFTVKNPQIMIWSQTGQNSIILEERTGN